MKSMVGTSMLNVCKVCGFSSEPFGINKNAIVHG
jgi:hypothetical protein